MVPGSEWNRVRGPEVSPLTSHVVRVLVRFWLKRLTANIAFGAYEMDFWRETAASLGHTSLAATLYDVLDPECLVFPEAYFGALNLSAPMVQPS
jgi:hypothetical protein